MKIISTAALGDGALGTVSLFTVPQGQRAHFLGSIPIEKVPVLDAETTTIKVAGTDPATADLQGLKVKSIRAQVRFPHEKLKVAGGFEIFAGDEEVDGKSVAKSVAKGALLEIYDAAQPLDFELTRTTAWEIRVTLPTEPTLDLALRDKKGDKVPFDAKKPVIILLTLELDVEPA